MVVADTAGAVVAGVGADDLAIEARAAATSAVAGAGGTAAFGVANAEADALTTEDGATAEGTIAGPGRGAEATAGGGITVGFLFVVFLLYLSASVGCGPPNI